MELNIEQKRLVQLRPNGHILIKGVAGSGKTTVAVHRIPYLLNSYCFDNDDRILMLTYNKTLVYYLSYLYNKVDSEMQMSFDLLVGDKDKVEIKSIDGILFEYFSKWVKENNKNYTILTDTIKKYNLINQSIAELQKIYPNVSLLDQKNNTFLLDEIEWIKSCNYMEESLYQNADRLGRMSKQS
ncbi:MAG: UvrD-helicase domain-containing protein [Caloramator sp.]|nr:UvrD-helicase domain-containing protein [Caloramator sp.]